MASAPDPGGQLRGQIFRGGVTVALSTALVVGGFGLANGVAELTAVSLAMASFFVVGLLGWVAEVVIGPSLERVAQQREAERIEHERQLIPSAGGVLPASLALTGGQGAPADVPGFASPGGALKGRRLDVTLPEESTLPAAQQAQPVRTAAAAGERSAPPALGAGSDEFQDLASLLREAANPPAEPARARS